MFDFAVSAYRTQSLKAEHRSPRLCHYLFQAHSSQQAGDNKATKILANLLPDTLTYSRFVKSLSCVGLFEAAEDCVGKAEQTLARNESSLCTQNIDFVYSKSQTTVCAYRDA
jgi:hypothetical protein